MLIRISHVSKLIKCIMKKIIQVLSTGMWLRYQYGEEWTDYKFPRGGKNVLQKIHKGNWELGTLLFRHHRYVVDSNSPIKYIDTI